MASNAQIVYREVAPGVLTFSFPFARFGVVPIGGRSTAIRMRDGQSVWLIASSPLDQLTKDKLNELGKVRYIVAPDSVHWLFLKEYAKEYPEAKVIGVLGHDEKKADVKFNGRYGVDKEDTKYGFEEEISARFFPTFSNRDVAFFHRDSKTLLTADLLFNLPANEQYKNTPKGHATSPIPFVAGLSTALNPYSSMHTKFLANAGVAGAIPDTCVPSATLKSLSKAGGTSEERKKRFGEDAAHVAGWDFERIIMCHGEVIESNSSDPKKSAKSAWLSAFSSFLNPDGTSKF